RAGWPEGLAPWTAARGDYRGLGPHRWRCAGRAALLPASGSEDADDLRRSKTRPGWRGGLPGGRGRLMFATTPVIATMPVATFGPVAAAFRCYARPPTTPEKAILAGYSLRVALAGSIIWVVEWNLSPAAKPDSVQTRKEGDNAVMATGPLVQ